MTIEAKIVAHSKHAISGKEIITYSLTYPRFIHSEFMTHRMFSRNASSSRAIPVLKQIEMVENNPAIPLAFTRNKAGMQGGELLTGDEHERAVRAWLDGRDRAVATAKALAALEVHKQYANRVIEPYSHISVVCTATEFDNFFSLRYHSMAQPEICALATAMWEAKEKSTAVNLDPGYWHMPYYGDGYWSGAGKSSDHTSADALKISTARCARVSYLTHEGKTPTLEEDAALYTRLVGSQPIHASPAEHQAFVNYPDVKTPSGNFTGGWVQHRKLLPNENISEFDLEAALKSFN